MLNPEVIPGFDVCWWQTGGGGGVFEKVVVDDEKKYKRRKKKIENEKIKENKLLS